jgi:hypothetical protein
VQIRRDEASLHDNDHFADTTNTWSSFRVPHVGLDWSYKKWSFPISTEHLGYTIQFFKISNLKVTETFALQEEQLFWHIQTISLYEGWSKISGTEFIV